MGLRETINKHQSIVFIAVLLVILLAVFVIYTQATGPTVNRARTYFTVDDGATWFADDADKSPPFLVDGKEAVLAHLYTCADGKPRLGYLEKYAPELKKAMDAVNADRKAGKTPDLSKLDAFAGPWFHRYKKPGGKEWVTGTNADAVMSITCQDGSDPETVR